MKRFLLVLFLSVILPFVANAQVDREVKKSVKIYFRQGSSVIDENYKNNKATLRDFADEVKTYYGDSTARFRQIRILSSVSPEGGKLVNERIAKQRAQAITDWISREIRVNLEFAVLSMGIDWDEFITLVEANDQVPYRDEVLDILRNTPDIVVQDGKEIFMRYEALQKLRGGAPYKWLYSNIFPELRYAAARCEFWWEVEPALEITSASPLRYSASGAKGLITFDKTVDDNIIPTVSSSADWVNTLIPTNGEVTFDVAPNPTAEPRKATITLSCYGKDYVVEVEQYGNDNTLHITSAVPVKMPAEGGDDVVTYEKSADDAFVPTAVCDEPWISNITPTKTGVSYTVAPNNSAEPRQALLTVSCYGKDYEIPVEQAGVEPSMRVTSASPVNYPVEGGSDAITYEKNVDDGVLPKATCAEEWITDIAPAEDGKIAYNVAPNTTGVAREATILVDDGYGNQHPVEVAQAASACKPFYMAIKTNMLYDVALVPNIGAEFYLGKNFSIAANYAHAWWSKESKSLYWRYYGADASIRWWFGKPSRIKPLQGHHIGLNYQILTSDFQLGGKGIMAGMPGGNLVDRASHVVAFEYGYSLPISYRLNLDFAVGFGYHWGLFEEYNTVDGHFIWQATKRRHYLGPTKLEVSLVWLIGCDNYNKDKGGKRR